MSHQLYNMSHTICMSHGRVLPLFWPPSWRQQQPLPHTNSTRTRSRSRSLNYSPLFSFSFSCCSPPVHAAFGAIYTHTHHRHGHKHRHVHTLTYTHTHTHVHMHTWHSPHRVFTRTHTHTHTQTSRHADTPTRRHTKDTHHLVAEKRCISSLLVTVAHHSSWLIHLYESRTIIQHTRHTSLSCRDQLHIFVTHTSIWVTNYHPTHKTHIT